MLKEKVKFVDYNGKPRELDLYFNLTEPEILRLEASLEGGFEAYVKRITANEDPELILQLFEKLLSQSYGEKEADGLHFVKNDELTARFLNSAMYEAMFHELTRDGDKAAAFFNGLVGDRKPIVTN